MRVAYTERFKWLKDMLAQPSRILSPGTKVVLTVIWEAFDKRTGAVARLQSTIAAAAGMTVAGVRTSITQAKKSGWLEVQGRGGVVYDEAGNKRGIASFYALALPDVVTSALGGKVMSEGEQGDVKQGVRCCPDIDNTSFSSSFFPHKESEMEKEPEGERTAHRLEWGDRWPSDDTTVRAYRPIETARRMVGTEACRLLGYSSSAPRRDGMHLDWWINENMNPATHERLAQLMICGKLKAVDLAEAVASMGLELETSEEAKEAAT